MTFGALMDTLGFRYFSHLLFFSWLTDVLQHHHHNPSGRFTLARRIIVGRECPKIATNRARIGRLVLRRTVERTSRDVLDR